jgi:hypothetical protein
MTLPVSPVDALFPVSVIAETHTTAARQHAQDEANRRRQRHAEEEAAEPEAPVATPPDPESPPTTGTLLDVKV